MRKFLLYSLALGLFMGCESPYEFEELTFEEYMVIDGKVSTVPGGSRIILSYTSGFTAETQFARGIADASVWVIDEFGNRVDFTNSNQQSIYLPPDDYVAQMGVGYQLFASVNGESIQSTVELVNPTIPFGINAEYFEVDILTDANSVQSRYGHNLYANFGTNLSSERFLKWTWSGDYEHPYTYKEFSDANLGFFNLTKTDDLALAATDIFNVGFFINQNRSWVEPIGFVIDTADLEPDDYKGQLTEETAQTIIDSLTEVNNTTSRKEYEYQVTITQESHTLSSYDYWQDILQQKRNTGTIFDSQPNSIIGNLTIEGSDDLVMGYFSAVSEISNTYELIYFVDKP